jgi:hypothetical protein
MDSDITETTRAQAAADVAAGAALSRAKLPGPPLRTVGDPLADPSLATRRLYASDWARFSAWCREQGRTPLPTSSQTFATYLLGKRKLIPTVDGQRFGLQAGFGAMAAL